ncbi:MAG: pilus assembly protein [Pseudomonadota bacterium]
MSFWGKKNGNVAMIFALVLVPVVAIIGFGIDTSRQHSAAQQLQQAVDGAVLSSARMMIDTTLTQTEREALATTLVLANFADKDDVTLEAPVVTFPEPNAIRISVAGTMPSTATSVIGVSTLDIAASAGARFTSPSVIEAALVLDVTGSMDGGPIADLTTAAKAFVGDLLDTSRPDIKIGLVPFAEHVNVGIGNRNADWIDVPADYSTTENVCTDTGCVCTSETTTSWTHHETGAPMTGTSCTNWDCSSSTEVCEDDTDTFEWYGCVKSRAKPYNVQDTRWDIDADGFLEQNPGDCPSDAIVPLTNVENTLDTAIDGLTANGSTYIPAGLAWGQRVLSPDAPFIGAMDAATFASNNGKKLLVLMSDGANTRSLNTDGKHTLSNVADANTETLAACTEIKTSGIDIFVIAFNVSDADTITMLQSCATTFTHYSAVTDLASLTAAFKSAAASVGDVVLFD